MAKDKAKKAKASSRARKVSTAKAGARHHKGNGLLNHTTPEQRANGRYEAELRKRFAYVQGAGK